MGPLCLNCFALLTIKIEQSYSINFREIKDFLLRTHFVGGIYTKMDFLLSQFWPIDLFIVGNREWHLHKSLAAPNLK